MVVHTVTESEVSLSRKKNKLSGKPKVFAGPRTVVVVPATCGNAGCGDVSYLGEVLVFVCFVTGITCSTDAQSAKATNPCAIEAETFKALVCYSSLGPGISLQRVLETCRVIISS